MNPLDVAYFFAAGITAPIWARKARGDWRGRFGHAPIFPAPVPARPRILLHAVSVGEVNTLRSLVPMLVENGVEVVVSVGTDTGIARARDLFASSATAPTHRATVVRYPVDFSRAVDRFLDAVKPSVVALVELEVWPNFIRACARRAVPVAVINGRLSERSFRGYSRFRPFLKATFGSLHLAAVQDEAYAARFMHMGVARERCTITGSMKWDSAKIEASPVPGAEALAASLGVNRSLPLVVAGSTGPGEEALLHEACLAAGAEVQLLCAPRKPERFDEAAAALPGCVRRSLVKSAATERPVPAAPPMSAPNRFLLDTIGELRLAYSLAAVVVVGRSFGKQHGSDPIEPISLGKATMIGPRFGDFDSIVRAFIGAKGIMPTHTSTLAADLRGLLADSAARLRLAERGQACIAEHLGATRTHAQLLLRLARADEAP